MTVVVGLVHGDEVWLGADSATTDDDGRVVHHDKLVRLPVGNGQALLASSGSSRMRPLVAQRLRVEPPAPDAGATALDAWASDVAAAISELAMSATPPVVDTDGLVDGHTLLAYGGRLWRLAQGFATPQANMDAIGSGSHFALGALTALADYPGQAPHTRVLRALDITCQHQSDCGGPLVVDTPRRHVVSDSGLSE